MGDIIAKLRAEQELDEAHAVQWWNEHGDEIKTRLWDVIQGIGGSTTRELVSRFAQIGFTHVALLAQQSAGEKR